MTKRATLSADGQVAIPKDVRDALGLKPGEPVEFEVTATGEVVMRAVKGELKPRRMSAKEMRAAIEQIREERRPYLTGKTTDEIMADLRGDEILP